MTNQELAEIVENQTVMFRCHGKPSAYARAAPGTMASASALVIPPFLVYG